MSDARRTQLSEESMGNRGSKAITGTSAVLPTTGKLYTAIYFIVDSSVTAYTDATGNTSGDMTAVTYFPAGTWLFGKWSSVTLGDGEAWGYYGS